MGPKTFGNLNKKSGFILNKKFSCAAAAKRIMEKYKSWPKLLDQT